MDKLVLIIVVVILLLATVGMLSNGGFLPDVSHTYADTIIDITTTVKEW